MRCTIIENYLEKHDSHDTVLPEDLLKHLAECKDCRNYYQLVSSLKLQKGSFEKAPEEILRTVELQLSRSAQYTPKESFSFIPFLKPSFACICILMICIVAISYLTNKNVGYVENLSKRFKLAQFENIKAGDMLYAGNNTTASIRLKSKCNVQIHNNTTVKVNSSQYLTLSRGDISIQAGDKNLQLMTPCGLLTATNTTARIHAISKLENGVTSTEITCLVFKGELSFKASQNRTTLHQGSKSVFNDNGSITEQQTLTDAEIDLEKNVEKTAPLFAAVESLCECINFFDYIPGKKMDHLPLLGKDVNESKYKVRVFWKAEKLNGLGSVPPVNNSDNICMIKTRRIRV